MIMKMMVFAMSVVLLSGMLSAAPTGGRPNALFGRNVRGATGSAATPAPASSAAPKAEEEKGTSNLNFNQTPLDLVFETYSRMVGKTILKDPQVPNVTITLKSEPGQKLTEEEQIEAVEVVLEMNGVHLEPYGEKFIRALPRKDVRKTGIPLIMDVETKLKESERVVSMMIPFKNIATDEAQKALEGLKSASGILLVFERTNSILVTDTEANINRMLEIAKTIDIASPVRENVFVRQIKNANAQDVMAAIQKIVEESQKQLEKAGNAPANQTAGVSSPMGVYRPPFGNGVLRRPGQPATSQPAENKSVVMTVSDADRGMIRGKVIMVPDERSNKIIFVTEQTNMNFFDKVIEQLDVETTPDTVVKVYRLKYANSEDVSDMINDLIGNSTASRSSAKSSQNAASKTGTNASLTRTTPTAPTSRAPANQRSGEAKAGELSKDNTTVLSDKRINGIVVMTNKELVPVVESIIESMDIKLSQVLIETVIIEVQLGNGLNTGIDWVQNGRFRNDVQRQATDAYGRKLFWTNTDTPEKTTEDTGIPVWETVSELTKGAAAKLWTGNAGYANMMAGGAANGLNAANIVSGVATNVFGGAFNYIFKSDKLNLSAIIQASKTDNRAKYLASPIVMTLDNKEATIDATESRKFFSGYETSSSYSTYMRTPKYDSKDIGIQIKVTPKINPNGTVMLNIQEEYSQVIEGGQSILVGDGAGKELIDTALSRKMSADALLENMQTVILCGLTETTKSESETGIPILKDIPWIGKWLFGSVRQNENRKELLVFMTPYVLDDAQAAQAEALRRKKTLSDSRPWEDHGWSLSELADRVSKKELLRRLTDEWKRQDEERETKLAIEKAKVDRVKKLKAMSKEERDLWLKMHKDDLDEEARKELEKRMLDDESQAELRKMAEEIRARKLAEANSALKEGAEKADAQAE